MQAVIYTKSSDYCPYCVRAKKLLQEMGVEYEEIGLATAAELPHGTTFPQIELDGELIGGYDDLVDRLLA